MRTILALSLAVALAAAVPTAVSQTLPAPPSGFQANPKASARLMREAGVGDVVEATKANDNMTECYGDPKSLFTYGWNLNPAGKTTIDMMLKAPQDPATRSPNTMDLDEPVSKQ